jgi:hypothetical protein
MIVNVTQTAVHIASQYSISPLAQACVWLVALRAVVGSLKTNTLTAYWFAINMLKVFTTRALHFAMKHLSDNAFWAVSHDVSKFSLMSDSDSESSDSDSDSDGETPRRPEDWLSSQDTFSSTSRPIGINSVRIVKAMLKTNTCEFAITNKLCMLLHMHGDVHLNELNQITLPEYGQIKSLTITWAGEQGVHGTLLDFTSRSIYSSTTNGVLPKTLLFGRVVIM